MIKNCVEEINKQGSKYTKHSNQWNVMQQLIDIVSDNPDISEIVYQDLLVEEMKLEKLVGKITGKRLSDPEKVMKAICDFYKIPCPDYLPPEFCGARSKYTTRLKALSPRRRSLTCWTLCEACMKRKQLIALPLPSNLKSTKHVGGKEFTFWRICALYSSSIDQSTGEEILIIDLFDHLSGEFMRRFFFSADNWFSIDEEKTVSSGQLMGDHYWRGYDFKPIKKTDALVIGEFFNENEKIEERKRRLYGPDAIDIAQCFCETIYEERKKRYRESTKKRTERELAELKEPPKGFYSWIDKTAIVRCYPAG